MSHEIADHVAALVLEVADRRGGSFSVFADDLRFLIEGTYGLRFSSSLLDDALMRLEALDGVRRLPSSLAGDMLEISVERALQYYGSEAPTPNDRTTTEYDRRYEAAHEEFIALKAYSYGGTAWIERVVESLKAGKISDIIPIDSTEIATTIPASDRIVTISDNQRNQIDSAAEEVSAALKRENSIDGDSDLRDRFLAQIAAARELIRVESVRAYLLYETLVRMLGTLISKYKDQALGEAAKKLLGLLIEHIFGK